ncbi:MAG TPA: helix-turn-helix domain-containing protein [Acidimicrobiia bacterium]|nr:helix-turn-helix domain-containing protein [Acidimicrobiia bacterium]
MVPLREAAARLGLSPEALRKRIGKGRLPAVREPHGRRRYLVPETALAELARGIAGPAPAGPPDPGAGPPVRRLRLVGEGELPVEAVTDLVELLRDQFADLRAERDRLLAEVGRLRGELDSAEVRGAALQGQIDRLRARLAEAPGFFLAGLAALERDWTDRP